MVVSRTKDYITRECIEELRTFPIPTAAPAEAIVAAPNRPEQQIRIHSTAFRKEAYNSLSLAFYFVKARSRSSYIFPFFLSNCICGYCCFASLSVPNNELSLTAPYGDHRIDSNKPCLKGFIYRTPGNSTRSRRFN